MDRRFTALFLLTVTLSVLAFAAGLAAAEGAGALAILASVALGVPALAGLLALGRIVYVDAGVPGRRLRRRP